MNQRYALHPVVVACLCAVAFVAGLAADDVKLPHVTVPHVGPVTEKATAATYVYEERDGSVPPPVQSALNRLNRERHILASTLEADAKNGAGDVPEQYKAAAEAAKEAGLPALVVTAGGKVLAVVKAPKDEQAVMEAVK